MPATPPPRIRRTVLIVDDSESIRSVLGRMLNLHGYETVLANDGGEALRLAREHRPYLILLDVMMPVLDGWGAIRALKSDPETSSIPVVALTALPLAEHRVHEAGFAGLLTKPVTAHRLREEMRLARRPQPERRGARPE